MRAREQQVLPPLNHHRVGVGLPRCGVILERPSQSVPTVAAFIPCEATAYSFLTTPPVQALQPSTPPRPRDSTWAVQTPRHKRASSATRSHRPIRTAASSGPATNHQSTGHPWPEWKDAMSVTDSSATTIPQQYTGLHTAGPTPSGCSWPHRCHRAPRRGVPCGWTHATGLFVAEPRPPRSTWLDHATRVLVAGTHVTGLPAAGLLALDPRYRAARGCTHAIGLQATGAPLALDPRHWTPHGQIPVPPDTPRRPPLLLSQATTADLAHYLHLPPSSPPHGHRPPRPKPFLPRIGQPLNPPGQPSDVLGRLPA